MPLRPPAGFIRPGYNPLLVPNAPTIGTATSVSATSVSITFTAPSVVGGGAITGYIATARRTSDGTNVNATGSSSPITITGLVTGAAYTVTVVAVNSFGPSVSSVASNSVVPAEIPAWNEAGSGATRTALINNLLYAGLGNTVYQYANVATLVKNNTNPKSTSGLSAPSNYNVGNNYSAGSTHGMTSSAPTQFNSSNGYGTNSFRTAKTSAPNLRSAWDGSPNPGIACMWYQRGEGGMHFIGNADCTSRYLLDNNPSGSSWTWIVVDIFNNVLYWNGANQGNAGGTYTNLFCAFYMGWTNSNTIDGFYHDYRVYQYDSGNHSAMVSALLSTPSTSYYLGGL